MRRRPLAEEYYSQTPYRYGSYVAKIGVVPATAGLKELFDQPYDPETPDAFREDTNAFFRRQSAEFDIVVQLNTDLEAMPIEDAQAKWSEELSPYRVVARLKLPAQTAWDPGRDAAFENLSFAPSHALEAHRPLGSVNRARLAVYGVLANTRRQENNKPTAEIETVPAIPA